MEYQHVFTPNWDEGKPRPYNVNVFWFWAIEIPMRFPLPLSASTPMSRSGDLCGITRFSAPAVGGADATVR
ncbi:MAG: hypothetical protein LBQ66_05030 [Planctomycetaceae bacterium]|nr:hypothetical protein [Planctomycetaceae bacterium]